MGESDGEEEVVVVGVGLVRPVGVGGEVGQGNRRMVGAEAGDLEVFG